MSCWYRGGQLQILTRPRPLRTRAQSIIVLQYLRWCMQNVEVFAYSWKNQQNQQDQLASSIIKVIEYVSTGQFNAAKVLWVRGVARRHLSSFPQSNGVYNLLGCEDELSLFPLEPYLNSFAISRECDQHGVVYETSHNISAMGIVGRMPADCWDTATAKAIASNRKNSLSTAFKHRLW